jgi:hypothetical protein
MAATRKWIILKTAVSHRGIETTEQVTSPQGLVESLPLAEDKTPKQLPFATGSVLSVTPWQFQLPALG